MARDLTTGFITEIDKTQLNPLLFFKFEFDSGDLNFWTGYGDIVWNSETYTGSGNMLSISSINETQDLVANAITFTLSGAPSSLNSLALSENYSGRKCSAWFAVRDDNAELIASPYLIFSGLMDVMEIKDGGSSTEITLTAESDLNGLRQSNLSYYTPESQKADYSSDKGFDLMPTSQDVVITWGAGRKD